MSSAPSETHSTSAAKPKAERPIVVQRALSAQGWWKSLNPQPIGEDKGGGMTSGDRAALARLRRASTVFEAATEPAVANLYRLMKFSTEKPSESDIICAAVVAGVLAHVRKAHGMDLANAMGRVSGERSIVSPLRMRRFMAARDPDDVMQQFRRMLAMLDGTASPRDVALQVLNWLDKTEAGERARTRFAFAYHGERLADDDDEADAAVEPAGGTT